MISQHITRKPTEPAVATVAEPSTQAAEPLFEQSAVSVQPGNGSVAHQIIGQFLDELGKDAATEEIASNLRKVVFGGKPSELDLKIAMFGI
ncbi:hypothetical protein [Variovorax paradoxus]|uniref:hypothetical protein n=1 Tax=Variovorax paradoxus TaxID=34073 RepID=UPI00247FB155|nr:hypothetical protein [Variovorax paradoxus]WGT65009.1 hypothetical protein QHG62_06605 [Variovorax paradoxus]